MSNRTIVLIALALALPGLVLRLGGIHLGTVTDTALYGVTILGAAFLLAWAAEAAEVDVAQGVAVAFIAFIAVLPEYAVDISFAWAAPTDPEAAHFAIANMTGGNRLLIGAAWPLIVAIMWYRSRQHVLHMEPSYSVEVVILAAATIYSFVIPFKSNVSLIDAAVLFGIFVAYLLVLMRAPTEEPELVGPARMIGSLPRVQRRMTLLALFVYSAGAVFASAEPFAHGLVDVGKELGVDEFLLVQWLAPLASESPEFVVTAILAWRGRTAVAMGALLSSKVNQWTLLVGGLPVAYAISGGTLEPMHFDVRQQEEVFLTAAQSVFAVAILASLSLSVREAGLLFGLFFVQLLFPTQHVPLGGYDVSVRVLIGIMYLVLAAGLLFRERNEVRVLLRTAASVFKDPKAFAEAHAEPVRS